jgi:hypothetical protein
MFNEKGRFPRRPWPRNSLFLVLLATCGVLSFAVVSAALESTPALRAAPPPPVSAEAVATAMARIHQQAAASAAKGRFTGKVGAFEIVATQKEAAAAQPCQAVPSDTRDASDLKTSELNVPGTWEDEVCADGTVVSSHGALGARSYFLETARVAAQVPSDLLEAQTLTATPR